MAEERDIVIVGAGGHGRVVLDTCRAASLPVAGFLDSKQPAGAEVDGLKVLGDNALLDDKDFITAHCFVVAVGDQSARAELARRIAANGGAFATVIHPSCILSPRCRIGEGSVVIAGAIVNTGARIGRHCIVNTGATIDHDVVLENGVQVSPGVNLAGHVHCGANAFIGTGAAVIPQIRIGAEAVVGAGTVVIRDVPAGTSVAGNPARTISV